MARPPCACDSSWSGPLVHDCAADAEIQTSEFPTLREHRDRGHIKQQASRSQRDIRPIMCFNLVGKLPLRRLQDSRCLLFQARRVRKTSLRCRSTARYTACVLRGASGNPTRDWRVVLRRVQEQRTDVQATQPIYHDAMVTSLSSRRAGAMPRTVTSGDLCKTPRVRVTFIIVYFEKEHRSELAMRVVCGGCRRRTDQAVCGSAWQNVEMRAPGLQHETHGGTRMSSGTGARKLCAIELVDFLATATGFVDSTRITHRARPCTPHTNHDAHRTLRNTHSGIRNAQHEVPIM